MGAVPSLAQPHLPDPAQLHPCFLLCLDSSPDVSLLCAWPWQQVKLGSPDYVNRDSDEATEDFMRRIECYENSYESLDEDLDRWARKRAACGCREWVVGVYLASSLWLPLVAAGGSTPKGGGGLISCFFPWGRNLGQR